MSSFYENPNHVISALSHYLLIFAEGHERISIPTLNDNNGNIDIPRTFELDVYEDFPKGEKEKWINAYRRSQNTANNT